MGNRSRSAAILIITLPVLAVPAGAQDGWFLRGDADGSGSITVTDPVMVLWYAFRGGLAPIGCLDAADADDDGRIEVTDAIVLLRYLFAGGPPPAAPYPLEGADGTQDLLDCQIPRSGTSSGGYFLCIDRSSSMMGAAWNQVRSDLLQTIASLGPTDDFSILFFDASLVKFPTSGIPARGTAAMKAAAAAMIESTSTGGGGTCPKPALIASLGFAAGSTAETRRILFYSDGGCTCPGLDSETYARATLAEVTARNTGHVRIDAFGAGADGTIDEDFLTDLAGQNGGTYRRLGQ